KIPADDELLPTIHPILDPGAASFSRLVVAVLLFPDNSFKPLLADRGKQIVWHRLDVIYNPDSLVLGNKEAFQERSTLDQRKPGEVMTLPAQQIKNVVKNPRCLSAEVLQEVEVRAAAFIDCDDFSMDDCSLGQIRQRLHDVGKLSIERFFPPREQRETS